MYDISNKVPLILDGDLYIYMHAFYIRSLLAPSRQFGGFQGPYKFVCMYGMFATSLFVIQRGTL